MDENTVRLLDLFQNYQPEEDIKRRLDHVKVFDAKIDMNRRQVSVTVQLSEYMPRAMVRRIQEGIARAYTIRGMELRTLLDSQHLEELRLPDVGAYITEQYAPGMSILAGCTYELEGQSIKILLKGRGKDMLLPYLSRAEQWLTDMFGTQVCLEAVEGDQAEGDALFAATEKLRQKAMEKLPPHLWKSLFR